MVLRFSPIEKTLTNFGPGEHIPMDGSVLRAGFGKLVRKFSEAKDGSLAETYRCFDGGMRAIWAVSDGRISPIYGCRIAYPKFCFSYIGSVARSENSLRRWGFRFDNRKNKLLLLLFPRLLRLV